MIVSILSLYSDFWDYGSYHLGDQRRLRRACASAESRQIAHIKYGSRRKVRPKIHWLSAHADLKNKFTEVEKSHYLMRWHVLLMLFRIYSSVGDTYHELFCLVNPHLPNGFPILINWTSPFPILGVSGVLFHFYSISNRNSCKRTVEPLIRRRIGVWSGSALFPMSQKWDTRLIWVKTS